MQPSTANWQRREDLGLRYEEFDLAMNQQGFIGHRVLPIMPRGTTSGKFPRVALEQMLQRLNTRRNPDGTYNRSRREFSDDTYDTTEHGLEAVLDDRTVNRYDDLIDAEVFEGEVIENALLTEFEIEVSALVFNETTFAGRTSAVSVPWSDLTNSQPATDVNNAINTIRLASGVKPNAIVINDPVFRNLIFNEQIISTLKYQGFQDARPGEISKQALAISLNVDEVIVSEGIYNTVEPGVTPVLADIWSNEYALIGRLARTRNPMERCIGRTVMWDEEGATNGDRMGVIAETYYEDARRGGVLRRRTDWGLKLLHLACGYLYSEITTAES